jgi:hypothetical protein
VIARILAHLQKIARDSHQTELPPGSASASPTGTADLTACRRSPIACRNHPRRAWAGSCPTQHHGRG